MLWELNQLSFVGSVAFDLFNCMFENALTIIILLLFSLLTYFFFIPKKKLSFYLYCIIYTSMCLKKKIFFFSHSYKIKRITMVFNDLFKKLDKININKCKKPNEPVTYQQLEHIIDKNRSINFNDWAFFFITFIFIIAVVLNHYTLQWAQNKKFEFVIRNIESNRVVTIGNTNLNYDEYKKLDDFIKVVDSIKPYVRGMLICFSLIQYCRSSLNRITPILKDKCITPRVAYVFNLVLYLLYVILAYQIYMWISMRSSEAVSADMKADQINEFGNLADKLSDVTKLSEQFDTKYLNKYVWIILFVFLCGYVLSIISHFRKNKEDLRFYLEFLFGGDMISLLSKLYILEVINTSTMIKSTGNIDDYDINFNEDNLIIEKKQKTT